MKESLSFLSFDSVNYFISGLVNFRQYTVSQYWILDNIEIEFNHFSSSIALVTSLSFNEPNSCFNVKIIKNLFERDDF